VCWKTRRGFGLAVLVPRPCPLSEVRIFYGGARKSINRDGVMMGSYSVRSARFAAQNHLPLSITRTNRRGF
jgi:hypothetical protein